MAPRRRSSGDILDGQPTPPGFDDSRQAMLPARLPYSNFGIAEPPGTPYDLGCYRSWSPVFGGSDEKVGVAIYRHGSLWPEVG